MLFPTPSNGHSANVKLELHIAGSCIRLAQIGGGRLIFKSEVSLPGTTGEVRAYIDEQLQRWHATWEASDLPRRVVAVEMTEMPEAARRAG